MEGARFELAHAAKTPEILGELVDQDFFSHVSGMMLGAEGSAEIVELGGIFARQHQLLRVEAVFKGILTGFGLALGTAGSGRVQGIGVVGLCAGTFKIGQAFLATTIARSGAT